MCGRRCRCGCGRVSVRVWVWLFGSFIFCKNTNFSVFSKKTKKLKTTLTFEIGPKGPKRTKRRSPLSLHLLFQNSKTHACHAKTEEVHQQQQRTETTTTTVRTTCAPAASTPVATWTTTTRTAATTCTYVLAPQYKHLVPFTPPVGDSRLLSAVTDFHAPTRRQHIHLNTHHDRGNSNHANHKAPAAAGKAPTSARQTRSVKQARKTKLRAEGSLPVFVLRVPRRWKPTLDLTDRKQLDVKASHWHAREGKRLIHEGYGEELVSLVEDSHPCTKN